MNSKQYADVIAERDPCNVIGTSLNAQLELDLWWSHSRLGLILCSAYVRGQPMASDEIAELMGVSSETVRKMLKPLINVERVRVIKEGRSTRYKAHATWAEKTRDVLLRHTDSVGKRERSQWVVPRRMVPFELMPENAANSNADYDRNEPRKLA